MIQLTFAKLLNEAHIMRHSGLSIPQIMLLLTGIRLGAQYFYLKEGDHK